MSHYKEMLILHAEKGVADTDSFFVNSERAHLPEKDRIENIACQNQFPAL